MHNSKQTLIQQNFLNLCSQLNSQFIDKGNFIREQIAKYQQCRDALEKHVIMDDSNNQGLESSKPLQNKMKLEQKDLLVSIIRNLESIEGIKTEFTSLQKACND